MPRISVRNFVEFVLKKGSLDALSVGSTNSALLGSQIHRTLQRKLQKEYGSHYESEVHLKRSFKIEDIELRMEGRADGILHSEEVVLIDEIKTSDVDFDKLDENKKELYWAQVKVYGYFYCMEEKLEEIDLQLTFVQTTTEEVTKEKVRFTKKVLEQFFQECLEQYQKWLLFQRDWELKRNQSFLRMDFPFSEWRSGQRSLSKAVFQTLKEEKKLYAEAPTGTGKTVSTLFPTLKYMGTPENEATRVFYLTAKTITRSVAEETLRLFRENKCSCKSVTLTAKEKMCRMPEVNCTPEYCPYALNYYEKRGPAVWEALTTSDDFSREKILEVAEKFQCCPFEFSLDLSLWVDVIIGDYNYLFDPRVALERFFASDSYDSIFLIDEAHNLVDRARGMYSATLSVEKIKFVRGLFSSEKKLATPLEKLEKVMREFEEKSERGFYAQNLPPESLYYPLFQFIANTREKLGEKQEFQHKEELLELFFEGLQFQRISEFFDSNFVFVGKRVEDDFECSILCQNPNDILREIMNKGMGSILFSATFSPLYYFRSLLGANKNDYSLQLESPFPKHHQKVIVNPLISTTYKNRERTLENLVEQLEIFVDAKEGNYLLFFPSYQYMEAAFTLFYERNLKKQVLLQDRVMTEEERERFLEVLKEETERTTVAFCVLGGIFSEGIDLRGKQVIGVGVVSIGLPQINPELELMKEYFEEKYGAGFLYTYQIPGVNKVVQAAGRLIRTMEDKGVVCLIDERFARNELQQLFPQHWFPHEVIGSREELRQSLKTFWEE